MHIRREHSSVERAAVAGVNAEDAQSPALRLEHETDWVSGGVGCTAREIRVNECGFAIEEVNQIFQKDIAGNRWQGSASNNAGKGLALGIVHQGK
jgi:hypothetical protein